MQRKRKEEDKYHLLKKIRRLEKKIISLPESDEEVREIEEGEIESDKENDLPEVEFLEECILDENKEDDLEEEVLNILGVAPAPAPIKESLHKQIAERWCEILNKGLKKEEKETITKENPAFENVPKMTAPRLNKEVAAALNDTAKRRDQVIENRQKQMSTALACIGQALQLCLGDKKNLTIIKKMNEAGRLLCDSIFLETKARRNLVLSTINKDLKESLQETESADYLFGENLTEKIKTAKAVQKSGKELKVDERKKTFARQPEVSNPKSHKARTLNWRGPPQAGAPQRFQRSGGPAFNRQTRVNKKNEDKEAPRRGKK
ncbi:hypothetical protein ABMA27_003331 [Loxostege sticticalis]|uniref:Uncharacterized protein n=1 Tax=Loxostege sticticalis TaxID=481309 RepID=A0ABR3HSS3_LOXSC